MDQICLSPGQTSVSYRCVPQSSWPKTGLQGAARVEARAAPGVPLRARDSATLIQSRTVAEKNILCARSAMRGDLFSLAERQSPRRLL